MTCDEIVSHIAQRPRHDDPHPQDWPRKRQPPRDAQHSGGPGENLPVLNQCDAVGERTAYRVLAQQASCGLRIQGGETEVGMGIVSDDELHGPAAQVADSVEENNGCGQSLVSLQIEFVDRRNNPALTGRGYTERPIKIQRTRPAKLVRLC
jgi:hypothetical protein